MYGVNLYLGFVDFKFFKLCEMGREDCVKFVVVILLRSIGNGI